MNRPARSDLGPLVRGVARRYFWYRGEETRNEWEPVLVGINDEPRAVLTVHFLMRSDDFFKRVKDVAGEWSGMELPK